MLETIVKVLKESKADGWLITDTRTEGWEFYFIAHQLDQNRVRSVEHINLTVYKQFEEYLGSASMEIPVSASMEEVDGMIDTLLMEAKLVKNPVYRLNEKTENITETEGLPDVKAIAKDFLEVMKELPETDTEFVNSFEIFVDAKTTRILNSHGIDVSFVYPSSMIEVVVNARREMHEIELYRLYHSGTCDKQLLKNEITETLQYGKDRLQAVSTPNLGSCAVVFSTDAALEIYHYFIDRMNTSARYRKLSNWEIGIPITDDVKGDRITVKALRTLENSNANQACDREGAPVRDLVLIDANVPVNYYGPRQFSQYLGVDNSFIPGNFEVSGGTKEVSQLRSGTYLEVVEFSDFQVELMTGAIAGEIRLGYLHEGEGVTIVTGGSVSGTMNDFVRELYASKQQKQYNNCLIPSVTRLENVSVTGAQ